MAGFRHNSRCTLGFTLVEAMFLMSIFSIIALAAGVGLQALTQVPVKNDEQLSINNTIADKLEQLRGTSFDALAAGTTTETVSIRARNMTRTTTIALADATGGSTPAPDFKLVTVAVGGRSISCYLTKP